MVSIPNQWELNDMVDWQSERRVRDDRLKAGSKFAKGKILAPNDATALLEAVVRPGDRICLEGDNQKQADFLAACLAKADPKVLHDLHVVQSGIVLPEHLDSKRVASNGSNGSRPMSEIFGFTM
jgi:malonate decarboxylase alpha subunit